MLEDGTYLIPANSKKGELIFGFLRPIDLGILSIGLAATIILAVMVPLDNTVMLIMALLPLITAVLLIAPIPNHHNVLVMIITIIQFFSNFHKKHFFAYINKKSEIKKDV